MSEFPALPLFTDAYIADTTHLTCEEHGAYLRLLMIAWRAPQCALPDDDRRLAMMLGLSLKRWLHIKPTVMAFWSLEDGFWMQKRLTEERQFVRSRTEARRKAGRLGGRPKSLENHDRGEAEGSAGDEQTETWTKAPTPTPTPRAGKPAQGIEASRTDPSDSLDLRMKITQLFGELAGSRLPPETGRAALWLAQGYDRNVILGVIRDGLERKPDIRTLTYFDAAIREAHERRAPAPQAAAPEDPEKARRGWRAMALGFFRDRHWSDSWGPSPEREGCRIPGDILREAARECRVPWTPPGACAA